MAEMTPKRYDGDPCRYGHGTTRYVSSRGCVVCTSLRKDRQYKTNPGFRKRQLDRIREKATGVTADDYEKMFWAQRGVCACCKGENSNGRQLSVDHNHKTGQIRELLCNRCNMAVGFLESRLLQVWVKYLEKHNG